MSHQLQVLRAALDPDEGVAAVDPASGELVGVAVAHPRSSHVAQPAEPGLLFTYSRLGFVRAQNLVRLCYAWGARNVELHAAQSTEGQMMSAALRFRRFSRRPADRHL